MVADCDSSGSVNFDDILIEVLSHLVGLGPVWFCMQTWSPTLSGGRRRVCSV